MSFDLIGLTPEQLDETGYRGPTYRRLVRERHRITISVDGLTKEKLKEVAAVNCLSVGKLSLELLKNGAREAAKRTERNPDKYLAFLFDDERPVEPPKSSTNIEKPNAPSRAQRVISAALDDLACESEREARPNFTVELVVHLASGEILRVTDLIAKDEDMILVAGETADGEQRKVRMPVEALQYELVTVEWPAPDLSCIH